MKYIVEWEGKEWKVNISTVTWSFTGQMFVLVLVDGKEMFLPVIRQVEA